MQTRLKQLGLAILTVLASLAAHASAECSANSRSTTLNGNGAACVCDSTFTGAMCDTQATSCASILPDPSSVDVAEINFMGAALSGNSVNFLIELPMAATRKFTGVRVGNCTENWLTAFQISTNTSTACMDQWQLGIPVASLSYYCTFSADNIVNNNGEQYERFNGTVYVDYSETVAVNDFINMTRTNTIALPVSFDLASDYSATLTFTNVDIAGSENLLSAAITGQNISAGATTSWAAITYKIGFPYQVRHMDSALSQTGGASTVPAALYYPNGEMFTSTDRNAPNCTGTQPDAGDYTAMDLMCVKTVYVVFTHGSACKLNGTYAITGLTVRCGIDVADTDCPLTQDATASISFTVVSENFCLDQAVPNVINNVITIDQFVAADPQYLLYDVESPYNSGTTRPYQWNTLFFMRTHFTGLTVYACQARTVETDWYGDDFDMVYATPSEVIASGMTNPNTGIPDGYGTGSKPDHLGLDIDTQAFLMMHVLDSTFAGGADKTKLESSNGPRRGTALTLKVRVTLDVRYDSEAASGGRRRRRTARQSTSTSTPPPSQDRQLPGLENATKGSVAMGLDPQTVVPYGELDTSAETAGSAPVPDSEQQNSATSLFGSSNLTSSTALCVLATPFLLSLALIGVF